jgi:arylsulfatase A-like enzyme
MMNRREFLSTISALPLVLTAQQRGRQPNIIFIMADDLGYGDLGCYGQKIIKTPNIDSIAAEGMRFTQAYAGCTVCAPSRSVLMTGLHMGHTSVRSNPGGVPLLASDVTVAEVLKQAGYATGAFGKWGLGDNGTDGVPWKQGFDEFVGYLNQVHAHYYYPEFIYSNDQRLPLEGNTDGARKTYSHDVIAERALSFIRRHKDKPFFCYMPVTIPHLELLVPEDSIREYKGKIEEKEYVDKRRHYADQPDARAAYAGMISRLDRDVGRVLLLLKELKLEKDTVVFFTSDNGSAVPLWGEDYFRSTAGLRGHKQNLYEGGIRVPMVARWPGRIPRGSTSSHAWGFWDVLPTFAEIAGAKPVPGIDGVSVLPTLLGKQQLAEKLMYWELPRYNAKAAEFVDEVPMQAARMGDWKAIRPKPDAALELYNLKSDPYEEHDASASNEGILAELAAYLRQARTPPRPQADPPQDFRRDEKRGGRDG